MGPSDTMLRSAWSKMDVFHPAAVRMRIAFPDKMLVQYDAGKLQVLAPMLRKLKKGGKTTRDHSLLSFRVFLRALNLYE